MSQDTMSMTFKYTVFQCDVSGREDIVVYPDDLAHSQVGMEGATPVSAGLIDLADIRCYDRYDRSESLGLVSRPERDQQLWALAMLPASMRHMYRAMLEET